MLAQLRPAGVRSFGCGVAFLAAAAAGVAVSGPAVAGEGKRNSVVKVLPGKNGPALPWGRLKTGPDAAGDLFQPAFSGAAASNWKAQLPGARTRAYSLSSFGRHVRSVKWEMAAVGGVLLFVGLREWGWGGSGFRFIREGWFGNNTRHGGMDKIGHAFSTYVIADLLTRRMRENSNAGTGEQFTAAILAFGIMGMVETLDGFTGKHRFSHEDIIANGAGALFAAVRNTVPGLSEKLDFRMMYTPASFEKPGLSGDGFAVIPPYYRQRYIFAVKASGFDMFDRTPLRFLELHLGFEARGFSTKERALGYPIERRLYVGLGLNMNELLFGKTRFPNFHRYRDGWPGWIAQRTFDYIQFPYTAVYYRNSHVTRR